MSQSLEKAENQIATRKKSYDTNVERPILQLPKVRAQALVIPKPVLQEKSVNHIQHLDPFTKPIKNHSFQKWYQIM